MNQLKSTVVNEQSQVRAATVIRIITIVIDLLLLLNIAEQSSSDFWCVFIVEAVKG